MKRKDKENLEFIKNKFDIDKIEEPSDLKADSIADLIDGKEPKRIKLKSNKFKAIISAAACFAIVITSLAVGRFYNVNTPKPNSNPNTSTNEIASNGGVIKAFASENELSKAVGKIIRSQTSFGIQTYNLKGVAELTQDTANGLGGESLAFHETYRQDENVDEGDIIKNNGKNIFWCDQNENVIKIYDGTRLIHTIEDFVYNNSKKEEWINDIYVSKNRLIVTLTGDVYKTKNGRDYYTSYTKCYIYDVSNVNKPSLVNSFRQSGYFNSSRMIGDTVYLVSNYYIGSDTLKEDYMPYTAKGDEENVKLDCDCIYYPEKLNSSNLVVISAIDTVSGEQSTKSKAFLGGSEQIYCNEKNMYITAAEHNYTASTYIMEDRSIAYNYYDTETQIVKIELDKKGIKFAATGSVTGMVNDQFSLDEYNGYLRIATTYMNDDGEETNGLFVFDKNLKSVGKISDFGIDESIRAVKFIGDTAYVITYRQTDPLFVIDVSNPENPQITGSVKITGFSSQLVPIDSNTLLGIGYATETDEETGSEYQEGIKLALFDVSNPQKPKVLDSYTLKKSYSEAQYNHKAIVINREMGYIAIPFSTDEEDRLGALVIRIDNGKINVTNHSRKVTNEWLPRCTYTGDSLYVFCLNSDRVDEYKINNN